MPADPCNRGVPEPRASQTARVRPATSADLPALAALSARAFSGQAMTDWLVGPGEAGRARVERMTRLELERALPHGQVFTTTALEGLAIWHPPGARESGWRRWLTELRLARIIGLAGKTWGQLKALQRIEASHPAAPHYYLRLLAVEPACQGRGAGTALMAPGIDACDAQGIPAYLETDTPDNVRYYERRGFRVLSQIDIPGASAALRMWTMQRAPQAR
jgi:ribosomal protein S18 acetylase RimI-like enzyme